MSPTSKKILYAVLLVLGFLFTLSYIVFPMLNSGYAILEIAGAILGLVSFLFCIKFFKKIVLN